MGNKSTTIRIGLLAATVALLVGCSGTQGNRTVQLPDPNDVPREKWSDAMHVLTAMGISGQRDVPIELAGAVNDVSSSGGSVGGLGDAGLSAVSFASPPTVLSGGAAAGIGLGLMLLGGSSDPARGLRLSRGYLPIRPVRQARHLIWRFTRSRKYARRSFQAGYRNCGYKQANTLTVIRALTRPLQIATRSGRSHSATRSRHHQAFCSRRSATGRYSSVTTNSRLMLTRTT